MTRPAHRRAARAASFGALWLAVLPFGGLLLGSGCAGGRESTARSSLTPVSQLPPERRELLAAYGRGGGDWEQARAEALEDPAAARFLADNLALEMVRAYQAGAMDTALRRGDTFERAQRELARLGPVARPLLVEMVASRDTMLAFLGADTLRLAGPGQAEALLPLFEHSRDEVRRRAVELGGELETEGAEEGALRALLAQRLTQDRAWIVRAQAARSLGERGRRARELGPAAEALRGALEGALADRDRAVRAEAARALGEVGDPRAVPAMIAVFARIDRDLAGAESTEEALELRAERQALDGVLTRLTGVSGASGTRAWNEVWQREGARLVAAFQLGRAPVEVRP